MDKHEYKQTAAAAASGDAGAFGRLYETLYEEMYYAAYYSLDSEADALDAVTGTIRDGFAAIGRLRSENAFRTFMMKTLCARIKQYFKDYAKESPAQRDSAGIKREFDRLPYIERLVTSLYVAGRFLPDEIAAFTGLSTAAVKRKIERCIEQFSLD